MKPKREEPIAIRRQSRPTRARGLKPVNQFIQATGVFGSRPTRARGLKLFIVVYDFAGADVAPHAGAWIETLPLPAPAAWRRVAPHAGAWIETHDVRFEALLMVVAPHAGAWIETSSMIWSNSSSYASRPTRARGLKRLRPHNCICEFMSRPTRARGLKRLRPHNCICEFMSRPTRARGLKQLWNN